MKRSILFSSFIAGTPIVIRGIAVYVVAIEREDGSGNCWNVTVRAARQTWKEFIRTEKEK